MKGAAAVVDRAVKHFEFVPNVEGNSSPRPHDVSRGDTSLQEHSHERRPISKIVTSERQSSADPARTIGTTPQRWRYPRSSLSFHRWNHFFHSTPQDELTSFSPPSIGS